MGSLRATNWLLLMIAAALLAHFGLVWMNQMAEAETFRLDQCVTDRPNDRPAAYVHVVMHGMAEVDSSQDLKR